MIHLTEDPRPETGHFWSLFLRPIVSRTGHPAGRIIDIELRGAELRSFLLFYRFRLIRLPANMVANLNDLQKKSALLLKDEPYYTLLGRIVYDAEGKRLGRVKHLYQIDHTNEFESFLVKKGIFSRTRLIEREKIQVSKKGILLGP